MFHVEHIPSAYSLSGKIVDIHRRRIFPGELFVNNNKIESIREIELCPDQYILPGLIDAHVHVESSMLVPVEFAKLALRHGTVACVSDPHEIANVLGRPGIQFMINNGDSAELKFIFGAPSCVPATSFETSGATLGLEEIRLLFEEDGLSYLSEVMNYPGVIHGQDDILAKIKLAKDLGKRIDGHAPGLRGEDLAIYFSKGITSDHECVNIAEAEEKIESGMMILIREGSAAKNFDDLIKLIKKHPSKLMLCTDDIHPDDLLLGHINKIISKGVKAGYDIFDLIQAATLNPSIHYDIESGLLRPGDNADFIVVKDLVELDVLQTFIKGKMVFDGKRTSIKKKKFNPPNLFKAKTILPRDILVKAESDKIRVITVKDGELLTSVDIIKGKNANGYIIPDENQDVLKLVALNRYASAKPEVAFIMGFGLNKGAIASSISHDSHNLIAVGVSDRDIADALNFIIENKGGISVSENGKTNGLVLEVAGIMTAKPGKDVAKTYKQLTSMARELGSSLRSPFMTLSFMSLLVIPELKLSDRGLFDGKRFSFTSLFVK